MADILDYHAQHHLRKIIKQANLDRRLKNLYLCGQSVSAEVGVVYLMSDGEHAHYHGHTTCKNPFACPVCSAKMMEKYRERINAAIKILKPTHFGFMVTLSVPHFNYMGWRETMDILYETHEYFRKRSYKRGHGHALDSFSKEFPIQHFVRAAEFTWSKKNGAHPHFHAIWWIPRDKFNNDEILKWEAKLDEFWIKTAKRKTLEYWKKNDLHSKLLKEGETLEDLVERLYARCHYAQERGKNYGLYFSKDKDGNLIEAATGDYIAGWGTDNELTGNYQKKASHEGHMTPYEILQASEDDKSLVGVYLDYCLAVTRKPVHHRVRFSFTGISKMIDAYLKEERVRETSRLEKKSTWEVVTYFDETEWYNLCDLDEDAPVLSNILWLAIHARHLLAEYLASLGISIHEIPEHRYRQVRMYYDVA